MVIDPQRINKHLFIAKVQVQKEISKNKVHLNSRKKQSPKVFYEKAVLKNLIIFTRKHDVGVSF